jgi:hypothetical protein
LAPVIRQHHFGAHAPGASAELIIRLRDEPYIYFDYGRRRTNADPPGIGAYTVPLHRDLVLAPVKWFIGNTAAYRWELGLAYWEKFPPKPARPSTTACAISISRWQRIAKLLPVACQLLIVTMPGALGGVINIVSRKERAPGLPLSHAAV